ncbi:MAG: Flp pilus assembly protein CpaB [Pseudomonadota bacterium]
MRAVFALVLVAGIGLAGFAVYMAQGFLANMAAEVERLEAEKAKFPELTRIAVVTEGKAYGEVLREENVRLIAWQADAVPEGAFTDLAELFPEGAEPRYVVRRFEPFEPVIGVKVTEPGADAGLTSRLTAGMRAFAIRVDVSSGVSGFLRPGDRVDVYWTGNGGNQTALGDEITRLIETKIPIIAVDQIADTERFGPVVARTVTVEVTPQQVAVLAQAQSTGRLSLSLVGAEDDVPVVGDVEADTVTIAKFEEEEVAQEVEERVCTRRTRRGVEVVETVVECTN